LLGFAFGVSPETGAGGAAGATASRAAFAAASASAFRIAGVTIVTQGTTPGMAGRATLNRSPTFTARTCDPMSSVIDVLSGPTKAGPLEPTLGIEPGTVREHGVPANPHTRALHSWAAGRRETR
jgi:hypothetical protein